MYVPPYQVIKRMLDLCDLDQQPAQFSNAVAIIRLLAQRASVNALLEPLDEEGGIAGSPEVAATMPAWDEAWYLERYPDVAMGVKSGLWLSGWHHYCSEGVFEWRSPYPETEADVEWWRRMLTAIAATSLFGVVNAS